MKTILSFLLLLLFGISNISVAQNNVDLLILNQKYQEALVEIDNQIAKNPSSGLFLKKGNIFQIQQNYQKALQAYSEGLQYEPRNTTLLSESAECFSVLGNNFDAISFYKKATKLAPENLTLAAKLGRVYINLKEYKHAYQVFSEIYVKDSTNIFWNKQLAYCAFRVFNREQAVYLYEKVLEVNPRDFGTYSNLIHSYNWKREPEKIITILDKGLEQFPENAELILEKATFFFKSRNYENAMPEFKKYFNLSGDTDFQIKLNYAISTYFSRDEKMALEILNELFSNVPNDPFVQYYISLCNKRLGNIEEAEKMMKWAIESSIPNYVGEMYHHLGQIHGLQREFGESLEALKKAHELNPTDHEILFEIATTYEEYNSNKTLALNYYKLYLNEAGEGANNVNYALDRISRIKEDMFFEE